MPRIKIILRSTFFYTCEADVTRPPSGRPSRRRIIDNDDNFDAVLPTSAQRALPLSTKENTQPLSRRQEVDDVRPCKVVYSEVDNDVPE